MKTLFVLFIAASSAYAGYLDNPGLNGAGGNIITEEVSSPKQVVVSSDSVSSSVQSHDHGHRIQEAVAINSPVQVPQSRPRVHEIHTHNARPVIRVEEYGRPNQVIRVHEAPQAPPEVLKIKGPAEPQSLIRVISKGSGPAHIQRFVHKPKDVQIVNVQKPGAAPARIIHVIREAAPAPKVEFHNEPEPQALVYVSPADSGREVVLSPTATGQTGFQSVKDDAILTPPPSAQPSFQQEAINFGQPPVIHGSTQGIRILAPGIPMEHGFYNQHEALSAPSFPVKTKIINKYHH